jgi:hypothetical protein
MPKSPLPPKSAYAQTQAMARNYLHSLRKDVRQPAYGRPTKEDHARFIHSASSLTDLGSTL